MLPILPQIGVVTVRLEIQPSIVCFIMKPQQKAKQLAKFLTYVLGRRPDEFGLVADFDGFITVTSLLQALGEDAGWRHVRKKDLEALFRILPEVPLELADNRVRATDTTHLPVPHVKMKLPKLLYTCVRRRAWPVVAAHGLRADDPEKPPIVATIDQAMALRRGRRIDPEPVLVTIHTAASQEQGALFKQYGELLYLTAYLPAKAVSGPPLPREKPQRKKTRPKTRPRAPGSFTVKPKARAGNPDDPFRESPGRSKDQRRRKEKPWQREKPPWRR